MTSAALKARLKLTKVRHIGNSDEHLLEAILGLTVTGIRCNEGDELGTITFDTGDTLAMYHTQSCCECVHIEDVCGDVNDLIGQQLTMAEKIESPEGVEPANPDSESFTWTFYKFGSRKGSITIRWYGSSNGYYSEAVEMEIR